MKKTIFVFLLMMLTLWLTGCEKETNNSLLSNDAEINEMITDDNEEYFEDDFGFIDSESSSNDTDFASLSKGESYGKLTDDIMDLYVDFQVVYF